MDVVTRMEQDTQRRQEDSSRARRVAVSRPPSHVHYAFLAEEELPQFGKRILEREAEFWKNGGTSSSKQRRASTPSVASVATPNGGFYHAPHPPASRRGSEEFVLEGGPPPGERTPRPGSASTSRPGSRLSGRARYGCGATPGVAAATEASASGPASARGYGGEPVEARSRREAPPVPSSARPSVNASAQPPRPAADATQAVSATMPAWSAAAWDSKAAVATDGSLGPRRESGVEGWDQEASPAHGHSGHDLLQPVGRVSSPPRDASPGTQHTIQMPATPTHGLSGDEADHDHASDSDDEQFSPVLFNA